MFILAMRYLLLDNISSDWQKVDANVSLGQHPVMQHSGVDRAAPAGAQRSPSRPGRVMRALDRNWHEARQL
jgi:hypothetical protein